MRDFHSQRYSWGTVTTLIVALLCLLYFISEIGQAAPTHINTMPLQVFDPWKWFADVVKGIVNDLKEGAVNILNGLRWLFFALPAPGDPKHPTTWTAHPWKGNFRTRWWNSVWGMYWGFAGIGTLVTGAMALFHWSNRVDITGAPINHHGKTREAITAFLLIVTGWLVLSLWIHGMNTLTLAVAPDGGELLATPENATKLGLGLILGAGLFIIDYVVVIIAILINLAQWLLILFSFAIFPVAIIGRVTGSNYTQVVTDTTLSLIIGLPLLKFLQVLLLRFVFSLPLGAEPGALLNMIVIMIGVFIAGIYLPYKGTARLIPEAIIATGGSLRTSMTGGGGYSPSDNKQKAMAVQQHSQLVANQVRVGSDSTAKRKTPNRNGNSQNKQIVGTKQPVVKRNDSQSTRTPTPTNPSSNSNGSPDVTVNTAVQTNTTNTAQAEAEASASSQSSRTGTGTHRGRSGRGGKIIPHPTRPLRRAKRKIDERRRKNS